MVNWCVKRTKDTYIEINKYFNKKYFKGQNYFKNSGEDYIHTPAFNDTTVHSKIQKGYKEISYETFLETIVKIQIGLKSSDLVDGQVYVFKTDHKAIRRVGGGHIYILKQVIIVKQLIQNLKRLKENIFLQQKRR